MALSSLSVPSTAGTNSPGVVDGGTAGTRLRISVVQTRTASCARRLSIAYGTARTCDGQRPAAYVGLMRKAAVS